MSQLTSILLAPYHFLFGKSLSMQQRNESSQALYFGIPALLFAIFGLLFLVVGELSAGKSLIKRYEDDVAEISKQESELKKELTQAVRMAQANNKKFEIDTAELAILRDRLSRLLDSKQILLGKLNSLAPEQAKYQFQMANTFFTKSELMLVSPVQNEADVKIRKERSNSLRAQGISIMKQIAPTDKLGYLQAHLFLAKDAIPKTSMSARVQAIKFRLANLHLDHALIRDENDMTALTMKVLISQHFRQLDDAKKFLKKLFEADPYVYHQLCQLNIRMDVATENIGVLHSAIERLSDRLDQMTTPDHRTKCATYIVDCYHRLGDIDDADRTIDTEIRRFPSNPEVQSWGKRLKSIGFKYRYNLEAPLTPENAQEMVGFLQQAYQLDPSNRRILEFLVGLKTSSIPGVAELSEEIYQPDEKAPASVENILGTQALGQKNYLEAAKHITRATQKAPNNGDYLNNLAYLYLIRTNPDPEEALRLVDRGILVAQANQARPRLTHFYDTKGRALLALGKIAEENGQESLAASQYAAAVAQLLKAIINRPNDLSISNAIVECYEANGQTEMAQVWAEKVKQLQAAQSKAAQNN